MLKRKMLKINLQLFSEPTPQTPPEQPELKYSESDIDKIRKVWEEEKRKEWEEEKRLSKLTEEEKQKELKKKFEEDLNKKEQELLDKETLLTLTDVLKEENSFDLMQVLNKDKYLHLENKKDVIKEDVLKIKKIIEEQVNKGIEDFKNTYLKDKTPNSGNPPKTNKFGLDKIFEEL